MRAILIIPVLGPRASMLVFSMTPLIQGPLLRERRHYRDRGEFGRMPISQKMNGRDHNPAGFSVWLAGGGNKGGSICWGDGRIRVCGGRDVSGDVIREVVTSA